MPATDDGMKPRRSTVNVTRLSLSAIAMLSLIPTIAQGQRKLRVVTTLPTYAAIAAEVAGDLADALASEVQDDDLLVAGEDLHRRDAAGEHPSLAGQQAEDLVGDEVAQNSGAAEPALEAVAPQQGASLHVVEPHLGLQHVVAPWGQRDLHQGRRSQDLPVFPAELPGLETRFGALQEGFALDQREEAQEIQVLAQDRVDLQLTHVAFVRDRPSRQHEGPEAREERHVLAHIAAHVTDRVPPDAKLQHELGVLLERVSEEHIL